MRVRAPFSFASIASFCILAVLSACGAPDPGEVDLSTSRLDGGRADSSPIEAGSSLGSPDATSPGDASIDDAGTLDSNAPGDSGSTLDARPDAPPDSPPLAHTVASFSPSTANTDSPAFNLTVQGTNFALGCEVIFNTLPLSTTYISPTALTASVTSSFLQQAGTVPISVRCSGTTVSGATLFTIVQAAPQVPTLTAINPQVAANGTVFTFTATGTNFTSNSKILIGTTLVAETNFDSATQLRIPTIRFSVAGQYAIRVQTVTPNGILQSAQTLILNVVN